MEQGHKTEESEILLTLYKMLFSYTPNLAYLIDKNCAFIDCNDRFLKHLGLEKIEDRTVGSLYKYMKQSGFWTDDQLQMMKKKDIETILSGQILKEEKAVRIVDNTGTTHQYMISRTPILDKEKTVAALLVQLEDMQKTYALEEQLEKVKTELAKFNANENHPIHAINHYEATAKTLHILVVEDNIQAQRAAQAILMQVDCVVDIAESEEQLLSLFAPGKYDLVFMDIGFEKTTGYILARHIRNAEKKSKFHVPIIALTSYNADMVTQDCKHYNMEGAITKPLTLEQARQLIQHYVFNIELPVSGLRLAAP